MISEVEYPCICLLAICTGHLHVFFGKMSLQVLCPFFVFGVELCELFAYFRSTPCWVYHLQKVYVLPFSKLPVRFVDGFFHCEKAF